MPWNVRWWMTEEGLRDRGRFASQIKAKNMEEKDIFQYLYKIKLLQKKRNRG